MKSFKEIVREKEGFFIDKNGHAVPDAPIHFKNINGQKISKKNLKEDFSSHAEPVKHKLTGIDELPGQHKIPPYPKKSKLSSEEFSKAMTSYRDANSKAESAHKKLSSDLHSSQRKPTTKEIEHSNAFSSSEGDGNYSNTIAKHLIYNHKNGHEPTHGMSDEHKEVHHSISNLSKQKLGKEVHLYSGVGFNPKTSAKKSKDSILHLPAHISTTHDAYVASNFADTAHSDYNKGRHMIHIHAKPSDKGYHLGKYSDAEEEHETVIPAGTKLKYSHSTVHKGGSGAKVNVHHFTIHSQE